MSVFVFAYLMSMAGLQTAAGAAGPVPMISLRPIMEPSPSEALAAGMRQLTPGETVLAAAEAAPTGAVEAVFVMPVRRAEKVGPRFFLNSEADYRDQRNLSVAIQPAALRGLAERFGHDFKEAFLGREVRVFGHARRVRIDFTSNGRATGKYYYQTHVNVVDARQIEVD